ncbi:MAG: LPP20 family lipoprotein [Thermodesulfobacteriota bacterium]|nr:LPP20 family lipoprotein [Thermodesulfobacteriota bacterium]
MNRSYVQLKILMLLLAAFVLILAGCAAQKKQTRIPTEEIQNRANRSFDDLSAHETGQRRPSAGKEERYERSSPPAEIKAKPSAVRARKGKRPDWVDGESSEYPSSFYMTGVGYAPDRQTAENKARAEISKIFYSEIDATNRAYEEYLQTTYRGKSKTRQSISLEDITQVSTQKVLSGVSIAQVYLQSRPEKLFYALAILDREQTKRILSQKIDQLDQDIQKLLTDSRREKDKLIQIKYLNACIEKHIIRQAYNTELRIVTRTGEGIPPKISFSEMKNQLTDILLRDFLIVLTVKGTRSSDIKEALVEALNKKGFSVSDDISRASVAVRGKVNIRPFEQGSSEWKFVRWQAYFDLVDRQGGAVFGSIKKTGKEGHLNLAQAEERAVRKIRKTLATDIADDITKYIYSQGK